MATMTATATAPTTTTTTTRSYNTSPARSQASSAAITRGAADPSSKQGQTSTTQIDIEITSDNICPFCYLGYKKVLKAIDDARAQDLPVSFSITFKPFILDPTLPVDHAVQKEERYASKFGDRAPAIISAMVERGRPWGIDFNYSGPLRNTFLSHRLVEKAHRAGGEKTQRALIEGIFAGYFEQAKDIGDEAYLAEQGIAAGVFADKEEAVAFLRSDELKLEVCSQVRRAQALGITGVPFVVINGKYAVSGAQEPEAFLDIFKTIACGECPCDKSKSKSESKGQQQQGEMCNPANS